MPGQTLALVSLGCAKNAVDLQNLSGGLLKQGYALSPDPDRADVVIVNTCAFIASAREEAEAEIRRALELKRRGHYGRVVVAGCYPQRYPDRKDRFPGVDAWQGVPQAWETPPVPGYRLSGKAFAYLKVAEGCPHRCAYCAIPAIRGKFRSRPLADVLDEARTLLASGCRELNVVAQDPMLWREGDLRLPDLLWALDRLEADGDYWVRVLYSYPSEISDEFLVWMATARHAVPYLDVPVQHTDPDMLARMNRRRAIPMSRAIAEIARAVIPSVTLRTTILTGFPGETDLRFRRMLSDLARMQFDHLGAFAYSPEEGTKGARMRGRPSSAVAQARAKQVMDQAAALWKVKAQRLVGQTFTALVTAPGVARLASQAPDVDGVTTFAGKASVAEFVPLTLTGVDGFDFTAKLAKARP